MKAMSLSTSDIDVNVPIAIKSDLIISHGTNEMLHVQLGNATPDFFLVLEA